MELVAKLDDWGKPAWIIAMILGFIVFWPIGLAILGYMIWSGRMGCSMGNGRWRRHGGRNGGSGGPWFGGGRARMASSGNAAFDEYREETLRRLEEEQQGFVDFLDNLRRAKDKAEFDQYMADRRRRPAKPEAPDAPDEPGLQPQN